MMKFFTTLLCTFLLLAAYNTQAQQTEIKYLSGTGSDNTVPWDFYCTSGRNSGKWMKIGVPSCWELQGFGTYNYGLVPKGTARSTETGKYKYRFNVPSSWKGKQINIVFDGSMTDTKVSINGHSAGDVHQGSFYRFKYNISHLVKYGGSNLLEVTVDKQSANDSVNWAERKGDFWIFGGIFRPVFLEALPAQHIERIALDGGADGHFRANVFVAGTQEGTVTAQIYTSKGAKTGDVFNAVLHNGDSVIMLSTTVNKPALWTPEFPNLYSVVFSLWQGGKVVHEWKEKFGFRTMEVRERDGMYLNGVKIRFKGVNRAAFWPTSGRTTNKAISIKDVVLMKEMNMNAVRSAHYPPDEHFLDVCDSLGLIVMDELTGWHRWYDTKTGKKLVKEMMYRDLNHASVLLWSNGNEGGFNFDLDAGFDETDSLQKRPLLHPWAVFRGMDMQHYPTYDYGNNVGLHGHNVCFPTEFNHGLYDGGHGAALYDYWNLMWHTPTSAGGFLWVFADEGITRTDRKDSIDVDNDHAPDGIVGPFREKEGSFNTIKEVWSPVYFEPKDITAAFDGSFDIENRYHFTNLNQCTFTWKLAKLNANHADKNAQATGTIPAPSLAPLDFGKLKMQLPAGWKDYDVLYITATDPHGKEIYTWSWPIALPKAVSPAIISPAIAGAKPTVKMDKDSVYAVSAGGVSYAFSGRGQLLSVKNAGGEIPFNNGPVLCDTGRMWFDSLRYSYTGNSLVLHAYFTQRSHLRSIVWTVHPDGILQMDVAYFPKQYEDTLVGISFSFPEKEVKGVTWAGKGPYRVWKNRMEGTTLGIWGNKYNNTITGYPQGRDSLVYPEFKGYFANFYWMELETNSQRFKVSCASEDVFLRLFTPENPPLPYYTAPPFPLGNISFMHGIPAIGTKMQPPVNLGPSGRANDYYDYGREDEYAKHIELYFDFSLQAER